jgi:hypothetical protein
VRSTRERDGQQRAKCDSDATCDVHAPLLLRLKFTLTGILPPSGGQSKLSGDPRMGDNREMTLLHLM